MYNTEMEMLLQRQKSAQTLMFVKAVLILVDLFH